MVATVRGSGRLRRDVGPHAWQGLGLMEEPMVQGPKKRRGVGPHVGPHACSLQEEQA
jgi:hypothetical protein